MRLDLRPSKKPAFSVVTRHKRLPNRINYKRNTIHNHGQGDKVQAGEAIAHAGKGDCGQQRASQRQVGSEY
eukprot:jgi/Chlat1/8800/Chrsp90S08136